MEMTLEASERSLLGKKARVVRSRGMLPAVVYGAKEPTRTISVSEKTFRKLFAEAGESTLIRLTGLGDPKEVLVQEVAYDPVSGDPIHVDFYAVEMNKKLQVSVPIEFEGEAPALKMNSTVLTKVLHEVEVECLPKNIPQHIVIDLSTLSEIGSSIHIKDIKLPSGVVAVLDPEDVVVVVSEVAEESAEVASVDMSAVEVEQKGKKEEESAE